MTARSTPVRRAPVRGRTSGASSDQRGIRRATTAAPRERLLRHPATDRSRAARARSAGDPDVPSAAGRQELEQRTALVLDLAALAGRESLRRRAPRARGPQPLRRAAQVARTRPSTSTVPTQPPLPPCNGSSGASPTTRDRSACDSVTLSYSAGTARARGVGVGQDTVRHVEQLDAVGAAVAAQLHPVGHLAQPGEPAPRLDVAHARRSERPQVPGDQNLRRHRGWTACGLPLIHASRVVITAAAEAVPQPRGGGWTHGTQ